MVRTCTAVLIGALCGCASREPPGTTASAPIDAAPNGADRIVDSSADNARGWTQFALSVEGRPLVSTTIGRGSLRILLIAGIHGNEVEGLQAIDGILEDLHDGHAARLATIRVIRDNNPDGTAAGRRTSANRVDLNRNWPASNYRARSSSGPSPLSEPETRAVAAQIEAFNPDLVIVFHSISSGPFVNYDGDGAALAGAFASAAAASDTRWRVVADMGYPTPGSLGSYVGIDRGIPILTIEFRRGQSAASAHQAAASGITAVIEHASDRR